MLLSIIIVSWNTCQLTLKCLKSIFQYVSPTFSSIVSESERNQKKNFEVILIDNNSNDGTAEEVEKYIQEISYEISLENFKLIKNKENSGFAKANNQAIKLAKGKYVLLLNPDTELIENGLKKIMDFMKKDDNKIGIIGPKLLNSDLTLQKSCRRFPTLLDQIFIQLKFYNFFPEKIKWIKEYFMLDFDHNQIMEVDQVMGAAILIKQEVFTRIGLLDEKFWAHFEEVDFCKRAKDAGFKIYFYPYFQIIHHKEQSFKQIANLKKQINFNRSLYYYFKKHNPLWHLIVLWLLQPVNLFLTWVDEKVEIRKVVGKKKDL